MKVFNVYKHDVNGYDAVKDGFSWPGFWFTGIWSLYKKLWWLFGVIIAVLVGLAFVEQWLMSAYYYSEAKTLDIIVKIGLAFIVGFKGNEFVVNDLIRRGYKLTDTVEAKSRTEAIKAIAGM